MRVAVIGGTGFVGGYLVDALLNASHAVSLLVRVGSEGKVQADVWRKTSGDVADKRALEATVEGCDAVIYCIGILRESPTRGITFESLQFDGAVRAVDAAKSKGVRRFLLMSANGAKVPGTPYQETKKRAEDYLLASGLEATVFRPSVIFGDPNGKMEIATQLYRDIVRPPIPAPGFMTAAGHVQMSPVHVADVADAFVKARASRTLVVFGFGSAGNVAQLERSGTTALRFPVTWEEIRVLAGAEWYPSKQRQMAALEDVEAGLIEEPPERLYDDRQLALAASISTAIKCECPHHLADLILSLCHFEEYSARCESQSREDTALHSYLHVTTAKARYLMEQALQRAIEVEGVDLDTQPSRET